MNEDGILPSPPLSPQCLVDTAAYSTLDLVFSTTAAFSTESGACSTMRPRWWPRTRRQVGCRGWSTTRTITRFMSTWRILNLKSWLLKPSRILFRFVLCTLYPCKYYSGLYFVLCTLVNTIQVCTLYPCKSGIVFFARRLTWTSAYSLFKLFKTYSAKIGKNSDFWDLNFLINSLLFLQETNLIIWKIKVLWLNLIKFLETKRRDKLIE